jgi:hypothetical protein
MRCKVETQNYTKKNRILMGPLYYVSSSENLTNFLGEDISGPDSISRDGRPCDDGIILVILEKRRGAKE